MRFDGFEAGWWWGLLIAAGITTLAMLALFPVAARLGLVDHPTDRKNHLQVTPATGGVAMLLAIVLALFALVESTRAASAFVVAAVLLVVPY